MPFVVSVLHADKCVDVCQEIIWTQTDNSRVAQRPSLRCQCRCGATLIDQSGTVLGGGGTFTRKQLSDLITASYQDLEEDPQLNIPGSF